jgi:hypothetical protein
MKMIYALAVVAAMAGVAEAKPATIAILGLDVKATYLTERDVAIAKQLTTALRARAAASGRPYVLAPGTNKELIDERLINECTTESPKCMAKIGANLGVDVLVWGRIAPAQDGYQVSLWLLEVGPARVARSLTDVMRTSMIDRFAKQSYARISGKGTTGTLVVKVNVEVGSVFIDGDLQAHLVKGLARIALPEGRYRLQVESAGYLRFENAATVVVDEESVVDVVLEPKPTCDFLDARTRGDFHVQNESFAAAVVAYDEALRCRADVGVQVKVFVAACKSKQADKARAYYAGLSAKLQRKHRAACTKNGIDPAAK